MWVRRVLWAGDATNSNSSSTSRGRTEVAACAAICQRMVCSRGPASWGDRKGPQGEASEGAGNEVAVEGEVNGGSVGGAEGHKD